MLEGRSGAKAADWEAFHRSMVHASPFLFDLDSDGIQDILLATYDGAILSFTDNVSLRGVRDDGGAQSCQAHRLSVH